MSDKPHSQGRFSREQIRRSREIREIREARRRAMSDQGRFEYKDLRFPRKLRRSREIWEARLGTEITEEELVAILEHQKLLDADAEPPKGFLIDLLVPPDRADDMLLELQKGFERWVEKYGAPGARSRFLWHSFWAVVRFWIDWMMKHLSLLKFFAS